MLQSSSAFVRTLSNCNAWRTRPLNTVPCWHLKVGAFETNSVNSVEALASCHQLTDICRETLAYSSGNESQRCQLITTCASASMAILASAMKVMRACCMRNSTVQRPIPTRTTQPSEHGSLDISALSHWIQIQNLQNCILSNEQPPSAQPTSSCFEC